MILLVFFYEEDEIFSLCLQGEEHEIFSEFLKERIQEFVFSQKSTRSVVIAYWKKIKVSLLFDSVFKIDQKHFTKIQTRVLHLLKILLGLKFVYFNLAAFTGSNGFINDENKTIFFSIFQLDFSMTFHSRSVTTIISHYKGS